MSSLPFVTTAECCRCGATTRRDRHLFTLTATPAYDDLCTGNLCNDCFGHVRAEIERRAEADR